MGPSDARKTTLVKIIVGMEKPGSESIVVLDKKSAGLEAVAAYWLYGTVGLFIYGTD
ncbi:hypothetical protein [Domibacillus tundrae]|uniref:hypothetical protein n=1 Tax=Domibacillus tundrae TaxID=1587527 RepID=UPI003399F5AF